MEVGLPTGGGSDNKPVQPVPEGLDWDFWLGPAPWVPFRGVYHWDWRWIMDYSGGQLTDWAGHHIDIAHWGLGFDETGPVEIEGKGVYPKDGIFNVPTEYKFTCKYANGVEMVVANDKQVPKGMGTVWYGEKGWVHVDRGRQATEPARPVERDDRSQREPPVREPGPSPELPRLREVPQEDDHAHRDGVPLDHRGPAGRDRDAAGAQAPVGPGERGIRERSRGQSAAVAADAGPVASVRKFEV